MVLAIGPVSVITPIKRLSLICRIYFDWYSIRFMKSSAAGRSRERDFARRRNRVICKKS
jgi:hypothetical protein